MGAPVVGTVQIMKSRNSGDVPASLLSGQLHIDEWLGILTFPDLTTTANANGQYTTFVRHNLKALSAGLAAPRSIATGGTGATTAAGALAALGLGTTLSDLARLNQNVLYLGLLDAAMRGVPTGLVDGILDPFSSLADINQSKSSGFTFNSSAGTIASGSKDANTSLLMHFDASPFTDDAGHTIGNTAVTLSATSKFGAGSASFNGSSSTLAASASGSEFTLAQNGTWTVEGWIYPTSLGGNQTIFSTPGFHIYLNGSTLSADNGANYALQSSSAVSANTWSKFELVNNAGTVTLFLNGASVASGAAQAYSTGSQVWIGSQTGGSQYFAGLTDEVRISQGIARHTASYTPETAPFAITTPAAMVLQSASLASAIASPSAARVLAQVDSTSAILAPNTDLVAYFSRDGGTTFTQGQLATGQSMPDGSIVFDTGFFSISGQPAGNSTMTYQLGTPTKKAGVLTGASMQVKP